MRLRKNPTHRPTHIGSLNIQTRTVRCYHCLKLCQVSAKALSSSCPHCSRQLSIADIVVKQRHWGHRLQTCGKVLIEESAQVQVGLIRACEGIEIRGSLKGNVVCFGPVTLANGAQLDGDLQAPAIHVNPGATILGGKFRISPLPDHHPQSPSI